MSPECDVNTTRYVHCLLISITNQPRLKFSQNKNEFETQTFHFKRWSLEKNSRNNE